MCESNYLTIYMYTPTACLEQPMDLPIAAELRLEFLV